MTSNSPDPIANFDLGFGVAMEGYLTPPPDGREGYWLERGTLYAKALLDAIASLEYSLYPSLTEDQRAIAEAIERHILANAVGRMANWGYSPDGTTDTDPLT